MIENNFYGCSFYDCSGARPDAVPQQIARMERKLNTMSDTLDTRFANIEVKLKEGSTEILAELVKLRNQAVLTDEAEATLVRIETMAAALANISPAAAE